MAVRVALAHMGMRPISNVVDATNYVMLVLGQPLHAFDLNTLPAREITVRAAGDDERMTTLDGRERVLTERDMLITSGGEPIAIAEVMDSRGRRGAGLCGSGAGREGAVAGGLGRRTKSVDIFIMY